MAPLPGPRDSGSGRRPLALQASLHPAPLATLATPLAAAPARPAGDLEKVYKIDVTGAPYKGPRGAAVTIVEFSDYQ